MPVRQRRPFAHLQHPNEGAAATRLTSRQQQILDWIRAFIAANGMPPTRAEIATGLGFSTASSAEDHLQALAKKGVLDLLPGAARGLRLKDVPGVPVQGTLPLVGRVAAGAPILAEEHVESHVSAPAITRSASAQSRTVRANGPIWSSELANAIAP